jgi:hypothetical protein
MIKEKKTTVKKEVTIKNNLFGRENYMWMLIGAAVLALGFFLMAGGKSNDPNVFNESEIYSPVRITLAPLLIIAGFVIEIFAIMKKSRNN